MSGYDSGSNRFLSGGSAAEIGGTLDVLSGGTQTIKNGGALTMDSGSTVTQNGSALHGSGNGTASSNVAAIEYYGGQFVHYTELQLSNVAITTGDAGSLATGVGIYTMPAGNQLVLWSSFKEVGVTLTTGEPQTDTPDFGIGTTIGSGEVATLDGTPAFENIMTGQTLTDLAGTAISAGYAPTNGVYMPSAGTKVIYINMADAYADVTDTAATVSGTVYLYWIQL